MPGDTVLTAFGHLPDETMQLRNYISRWGETSNNQGGDVFIHKSDDQRIAVVKLLNELRSPWKKEFESFEVSCL